MKYYLTEDKTIMAIGEAGDVDGDQSAFIGEGWTLLSEEELNALLNPPKTAEEIAAAEKQAITEQLASLTVTTNAGHAFDAYTQARQDMADAILASATLGITETVWRLADNSEVTVSLDELKEAHALAIQAYAKVKGIGA